MAPLYYLFHVLSLIYSLNKFVSINLFPYICTPTNLFKLLNCIDTMNHPIHYLYTIGLARQGTVENVVQVLQGKGVQCVVDVRERQSIEGEFGQNNLRFCLKNVGMIYMSFLDEFGNVSECCRRKNGEVNYEKACKDKCFVKGIQRLQEGMQKGYRIALLGMESEPQESFRALVIGRRLEELGCQVEHILANNQTVLQSALNKAEQQQQANNKQQLEKAAEVGRKGEDIATKYLEDNGFGILDRNWNLHKGCEIDIVAHRDGVVHFVEVKTRSHDTFATPESAINRDKVKHLYKAAKAYTFQHQLQGIKSQIDSIAIILRTDDDYELTFHENIEYRIFKTY